VGMGNLIQAGGPMKVAKVFDKMMELHDALRLPPLSKMPGRIWTCQIDKHWFIAVNGSIEIQTLGPLDGSEHPMLCPVHPFHCGVWFNGFYAGEFDAHDGVLCAGTLANEDTLVEAIDAAIVKART